MTSVPPSPNLMTSETDFLTTLNDDIVNPILTSSNSHILLVELPDNLSDLNSIAASTEVPITLNGTPLESLLGILGHSGPVTCDLIWDIFDLNYANNELGILNGAEPGWCATLTRGDWSNTDKQIINARITSFNQAMRTIRDQNPTRVKLLGGSSINIEINDLSLDCFHPSYLGQQRLASEAWTLVAP